jgi:Ser-tRNA(Ala) deacylase AlaX
MNRLIEKGNLVTSLIVPPEKVAVLCGGFPSYLPKDKDARVIIVSGQVGCPCGGTHVDDIAKIGSVKVTKIAVKKGNVRVSYEIS